MRNMVRAAVSFTAAVVVLQALPAHAESSTGLTFYRSTFAVPVLHLADPDGSCLVFPPTADSLTGSGTVEQVSAFAGDNCTGIQTNLGTLRTFPASKFRSFRAF